MVTKRPAGVVTLACTAAGATAAARAAAAALASAMKLGATTVAAVAEQLSKPAGPTEARGPFISVRRFSGTDANNHSALLFVGDGSQQAADGSFVAHGMRHNMADGVALPFSRNQMVWTGTDWHACPNSGAVNQVKATPRNRSVDCKGCADERVLQRTLSLGGRLKRAVCLAVHRDAHRPGAHQPGGSPGGV